MAYLQQRVRDELGIDVTGNDGEASGNGVTIAWHYHPETGVLILQCTHKPFIAPAAYVNQRIAGVVNDALQEFARVGTASMLTRAPI